MRDPETIIADPVRRLETRMGQAGLLLAGRMGGGASGVLLDRLIALLANRHPRAFATLSALPDARLLIDPVDAPAALILRVGSCVSLRVHRRDAVAGADADAVVRGPYARLLDLLEGRIDGDALFFRRELTIEGDTALILALRNTLDGEEMDLLADIASAAGPLARALPVLRRNAGRALAAVDGVRRRLPAPLRSGLALVESRITGPRREA